MLVFPWTRKVTCNERYVMAINILFLGSKVLITLSKVDFSLGQFKFEFRP